MSVFPRKESDVIALNEQMIIGLNDNMDHFPAANTAVLQAALEAFKISIAEQVASQAAAKQATEVKGRAYENMVKVMKSQLKLAEVDAGDRDELLALLGWSAQRKRRQQRVPQQPRNLVVDHQQRGEIRLKWDPSAQHGGAVRAYLIERRSQTQDGHGDEQVSVFSEWVTSGVALEPAGLLDNEPTGKLLEYRVVALNTAGRSLVSNTVEVVL